MQVRLLLIGIKEFEVSLSKISKNDRDSRIEAYDRVLTECKDALQLTKDDMRTDPHAKSGKKGVVRNLKSNVLMLLVLRRSVLHVAGPSLRLGTWTTQL